MPTAEVSKIPGRGRGVVAAKRIARGQLVEESPVIIVDARDIRGRLREYDFDWSRGRGAVALGFGSLFNHSADPNLFLATSRRRRTISFFAKRAIRKGEELTFDYGYRPRGYDGK